MRKRFMTYDSSAAVPGVPAPGGNVKNIVLIVQKYANGEIVWNQKYAFDEIYNAALAGCLRCYCGVMQNPDGSDEASDALKECTFDTLTLPAHKKGETVMFLYQDESTVFLWEPNGFHFQIAE